MYPDMTWYYDIPILDSFPDCSEDFQDLDKINGEIKIGDFILVKFKVQTGVIVHYIGIILSVELDGTYEVKFLRRQGCGSHFSYPTVDDIGMIYPSDVVSKLQAPAHYL